MDRIIFLPSVVVASVGLLASVITASLTYYFTKKHQLKMEERRLKEESYRKFIKALSDMALDNSEKNRWLLQTYGIPCSWLPIPMSLNGGKFFIKALNQTLIIGCGPMNRGHYGRTPF
jgi:hypothetical protein